MNQRRSPRLEDPRTDTEVVARFVPGETRWVRAPAPAAGGAIRALSGGASFGPARRDAAGAVRDPCSAPSVNVNRRGRGGAVVSGRIAGLLRRRRRAGRPPSREASKVGREERGFSRLLLPNRPIHTTQAGRWPAQNIAIKLEFSRLKKTVVSFRFCIINRFF